MLGNGCNRCACERDSSLTGNEAPWQLVGSAWVLTLSLTDHLPSSVGRRSQLTQAPLHWWANRRGHCSSMIQLTTNTQALPVPVAQVGALSGNRRA